MDICILGAYHLADGFLACSRSLTELGFTVSFFPIMAYHHGGKLSLEVFLDFLDGKGSDPTYVYPSSRSQTLLIWTSNLDLSYFLLPLREVYDGKMILHNWDPNWLTLGHPHWQEERRIKMVNMKYVDHLLTVNPLEAQEHRIEGRKAIHCCSGFHESLSYPIEDEKYKCDVSAVITNLYTDDIWDRKQQVVGRKELLDRLYADESINLHVYGPESIGAVYPRAYRGFAPYDICCRIFSNSRVNLCISPITIPHYFSERAPQIIGSGGLLATDTEIGNTLIPSRDYVLLDNGAYETIKGLLVNEDKRAEIARNGYEKRECLSWKRFGELLKTLM